MNIRKIDSLQLFCMIVLFQLGSSVVLGIGLEAKKNAWIAIFLSTIIGIGLYFLYICIYRMVGLEKNLHAILQYIFSRPIGFFLSLLYYLYFLYLAARVTADFSFFSNGVLLWNVPSWTLKLTILLIAAYICFLGIEALGRSSEALSLIMFTFIIIIIVMVFTQEEFRVNNLRPVLEEGMQPIFKAMFPTLITFPFGELIVFLCYFQYLKTFTKYQKNGWLAVLTSGTILMVASILNVGVLTDELAKTFTFPFIKTIEHINFLNFLHHIELLAVFVFIIGGLIKISIFSYAGITGLADLFKIKKEQKVIFPFLLIVYLISVFFMKNFIIHLHIGLKIVPLYIHLFFQYLIPIMGFLILLFRFFLRKRSK